MHPAAPTLRAADRFPPNSGTFIAVYLYRLEIFAERGRPPMPEKPEEPYFYLGAILDLPGAEQQILSAKRRRPGMTQFASGSLSREPAWQESKNMNFLSEALGGENLAFVEQLYWQYLQDPASWAPDWQRYFADWGAAPGGGRQGGGARGRRRAELQGPQPLRRGARPHRPPLSRPRRPAATAAGRRRRKPRPAASARTGSTS